MLLGRDIDEIGVCLDDYILTLTLNRPDKKNALTGPMYLRMAELIRAAGQSRDVRVVLIRGSRDCFSSGNDVATFETATEGAGSDDDVAPVQFLKAIAACDLPVVAAVNGHAVGVGTTMLLHCDFVIAGANARFRTPFVNLGVCPEAASSYTMPMRMGYSRAVEMLLLGEALNAEQAVACGLANAVHAVDAFEEVAQGVAVRLSKLPPASVQATKRLMRAPLMREIPDAMTRENAAFAACMETPEFGEAISAFMEGREADFSRC